MADSVKPTMSSGLQILTKGNPELMANWAARAVLPALGAPSRRMLTNPDARKNRTDYEQLTQVKYIVGVQNTGCPITGSFIFAI